MIRFLFSFPWGMFAASTSVAVATGISVFALGMPPVILIPVGWGSAMVYRILNSHFKRQFNR